MKQTPISPILYTYLKARKSVLEYTPFSFNARQ